MHISWGVLYAQQYYDATQLVEKSQYMMALFVQTRQLGRNISKYLHLLRHPRRRCIQFTQFTLTVFLPQVNNFQIKFNPRMSRYFISYKAWGEQHIRSQTSMVQPLKFGNWEIISSHTLLGMWLLIHARIKSTDYKLTRYFAKLPWIRTHNWFLNALISLS